MQKYSFFPPPQVLTLKACHKGFPFKPSAAAHRCAANTGLEPFLKGKQEHWTICLQKPSC